MHSHDKRPPVYRSASGIELKASYGPEDVPAEHARVMGAAFRKATAPSPGVSSS
jgi:hypothetical protein